MIYILDTDLASIKLESYALQKSDFDVNVVDKVEDLFSAINSKVPDLIIMDKDCYDGKEQDVLDELRRDGRTMSTPIMIVSADSDEISKAAMLDDGADDYMVKPVGALEFVARVRALIRRSKPTTLTERYEIGNLVLDDGAHCVKVGNNEVLLTFKEYELLKFLLRNKGTVVTRGKLIDTVWGFDYTGESRTVDMHIKTLRQKLGSAGSYIKTVRSVGYKIAE